MTQKGDGFLTLGQLSRFTRISRDRLRAACDLGRIPHIRSQKGYRLISSETADSLHKRGLDAFPPVQRTPEAPGETDLAPRRSSPGEKLGLLGQPSSKLQKLKESVESQRMRLEFENLSDELKEIKSERSRRAEEARAERDARLQEAREARERVRQEKAQAATAERRREWFTTQAKRAIDLLYCEARWTPVDLAKDEEEIAARLAQTLGQELGGLGPDSPAKEVNTATRRAVGTVLSPYKGVAKQGQVIDSALRYIAPYLRELHGKGWLTCESNDTEFLAEQLSGPVREMLEREANRREIGQTEAEELVRDAVDSRLQII